MTAIDSEDVTYHSNYTSLKGGIIMFKNNSYSKKLRNILEKPNRLSKDELFAEYLNLSERYLVEMISLINLEKTIIQEVGEERGEHIIEAIATSNRAINCLDDRISNDLDQTERIRELLAFIETEL